MAAEVLAGAGAAVTVFDRMPSVGRKLLLAGRSGLNLTHSEPLPVLLDRYGPARDRLAPAVARYDPEALRSWSAGLGEATYVGSSGRVFPASFRATPLLRAWLGRLVELGVEFRVRHTWRGWSGPPTAGRLAFTDGAGADVTVEADAVILALGGASWPRVGSDGAWAGTLSDAGVVVVPLRPSNCGFVVPWSEPFASRFAGTPLKNVVATHAGRASPGDVMITATGIEGGPVYALSPGLRDALLHCDEVAFHIDLRPARPTTDLADRLARRRPGDSMSSALRRAWNLTPAAVGLLREATANRLPAGAEDLARLAKSVPVRVVAPQPLDRAISSAGGIALGEIDERFMLTGQPGTFVAGEMLDWEAPTGGYLLQATFSTAVAAAQGALAWLGERSPEPPA
jgi:hypothetical protein